MKPFLTLLAAVVDFEEELAGRRIEFYQPSTSNRFMPLNKLTSKTQIIFVLLAVLLTGCEKKASNEIDFGAFNNSVYKNSFFGLAVTVPADWSIQDQEAQRRIMKLGGKLLAGDDKNLKAVVKASELQTVNLFAVFKYLPGSPVTFNPSICALADDVRPLPGIRIGKDYNFQVRKMLESSQMEVSFPKGNSTLQIGGVDFDVMYAEMSIRGMVVR